MLKAFEFPVDRGTSRDILRVHCHVGLTTIRMAQNDVRTRLGNRRAVIAPAPHALCKALSEISMVEKKNSEGKPNDSPAAFFSDNQSVTNSFAAARAPSIPSPSVVSPQGRHVRIIVAGRQLSDSGSLKQNPVGHECGPV
jgi:hypothetical protein